MLLRGPLDAPEDPQLDTLNALLELRRYPARHKCALLPFATLAAALDGERRVTTEVA
jgi:nitrogen fixation NifU-like protein